MGLDNRLCRDFSFCSDSSVGIRLDDTLSCAANDKPFSWKFISSVNIRVLFFCVINLSYKISNYLWYFSKLMNLLLYILINLWLFICFLYIFCLYFLCFITPFKIKSLALYLYSDKRKFARSSVNECDFITV